MKNSIKELRARDGFTQEDLAHEVGVSRQTINAIEKGKFDDFIGWLGGIIHSVGLLQRSHEVICLEVLLT